MIKGIFDDFTFFKILLAVILIFVLVMICITCFSSCDDNEEIDHVEVWGEQYRIYDYNGTQVERVSYNIYNGVSIIYLVDGTYQYVPTESLYVTYSK